LLDGLDALTASYEKALLETETCRPSASFHDLWASEVAAIVRDICAALREPRDGADAGGHCHRADAGPRPTGAGWGFAVHPSELLRAASLFLELVLDVIIAAVSEEEGAAAIMAVATQAAHQAVMARVREAIAAHTSYLLSKIHAAHLEERARMARELHDRLGSTLSAAARCVESLQGRRDPDTSFMEKRISQAEKALHVAVDEIRQLTHDLRLQTQTSGLETALRYSSRAAPVGTETLIEVVGDEGWATPAVLDELFLVLREAMRNAYSHACAGRVVVRVEVTPYELRASVADDGVGMEPSRHTGGLGLVAMRERVALMGGTIGVFSRLGAGTSVEARVPLPGGSCVR
jgi:signal transduction histidine kinase